MELTVYNGEGRESGTITVPAAVFGVAANRDLIHQALTVQLGNRRKVLAHTKDRSAVRGGGRKPWRQKGTGRARHGSIRSPLWRGGGITFGPSRQRNFAQRLPKKMKQAALRQVLSAKVAASEFIVVEDFPVATKTRAYVQFLRQLPLKPSRLIIVPAGNRDVIRAARNLPRTKMVGATALNVIDLLSFQSLVASRPAVEQLIATYGPKNIKNQKSKIW